MDRASFFLPRLSLAVPPGAAVKAMFAHATRWIELAFRTARERRQLMALDERALKDIGLSRADAHGEWSRPFWDFPRDR